jgi:hypothetical protein
MDKVELRGCLKTGQPSQATHHEMDHRDPDHGFTRLGSVLIILRSAAGTTEPGEGLLHDPALWQQQEALDPVRSFDHNESDLPPGSSPPDPGDELPRIRLIGPDHTQTGPTVPHDLQQGHGPVTVLHAGRGDHYREKEP